MNRLPLIICLTLTIILTSFTHAAPPRLIIRADDIGSTHGSNIGCMEAYKNGIATTVEIMVPGPWFLQAVEMLKSTPDYDVGVHLVLTSEWEHVKWRPISDARSIVDRNGYFFPMIWPNDNFGPDQALKEQSWTLDDIEKEFRAQIEMAVEHLPHVTHLTGHMGCAHMDPKVKTLVDRLAVEYGLDIDPSDYGVQGIRLKSKGNSLTERLEQFIALLNTLEDDQIYMFVEHPGTDSPEMQDVGHVGYENVARDRQWVTDIFTHPQVKNTIKQRGIELISYQDLERN